MRPWAGDRSSPACTVCGATTACERHEWLHRCPRCGFLASTLVPEVNGSRGAIDELARERALAALRRQNFGRVLDTLASAGVVPGARVLDVGCAHGWFVEAARARGYDASGLEPDTVIAAQARGRGVPVREGFFPQSLEPGESFDVIVFNDVFEHLPEPRSAMQAVRDRLVPTGLAVINLPLASGTFYRAADALDRIGVHGPFDRMWQRGFPSPHLSYFTQSTLGALAATCGLRERWRGVLPSLEPSNLWARLRYDRNAGLVASAATWAVLRACVPLIAILPPDIGLQLFDREPEHPAGRT